MNKTITSKEAILEVSRKLIMEQGPQAIHIRGVASAGGISVGSVYNYFSSKSELVMATVESIWFDIFQAPQHEEVRQSFLSYIKWLYERIEWGEKKYSGFFNLHAACFLKKEKTEGRRLMMQSWQNIRKNLEEVLKNDKNVREDAFNENFPREKFAELIFSMLLSAMLQQDYDCAIILEVVNRAIYENSHVA